MTPINIPHTEQIPVVEMACADCGNPNGPRIQERNGIILSLDWTDVEMGCELDGGPSSGKLAARWYCAACTAMRREAHYDPA